MSGTPPHLCTGLHEVGGAVTLGRVRCAFSRLDPLGRSSMLLTSWLLARRPASRMLKARRFRPSHAARLVAGAERLEARTLLTAYVVDTLDDAVAEDGKLSLREAIQAASTDLAVHEADAGQGGGVTDSITFEAALAEGTLTLAAGRFNVSGALSVTGLGSAELTISGNGVSQIFSVAAGATVSVAGLTLTRGFASTASFDTWEGGTIYNEGTLSLADVAITDSRTSFSGGAIHNEGTLSMSGGAILRSSGDAAVENRNGVFTASNVTFADNEGAIYSFGSPAIVTISRSVFDSNRVTFSSGAIENRSGTVRISDSSFTENSGNSAGAISNSGGVLEISGSTFAANVASTFSGGAIESSGTLRVSNSTFSGNVAGWWGGAIYANSGSAVLRNVTVTGNRVNLDGTGFENGAGIYGGSSAAVTLHNTIVVGNLRGAGAGVAEDIFGTVSASSSHNIVGTLGFAGGLTNGVNGNMVGTTAAAVLDPALRDNGGPTLTHAIVPGSLAIDAGADAQALDPTPAANPLPYDQRGVGFPRRLGSAVDVGAFERPNAPTTARDDRLVVSEDGVSSRHLFADNGFGPDADPDGNPLSVIAVNGSAANVGTTVTLASGALLHVSADGSFTYDPNGAFDGLASGEAAVDTFGYAISDGRGGESTATVTLAVLGANDRPTAVADSYVIDEDRRLVVPNLPTTALWMTSERGDWVGGGARYYHTAATAEFNAQRNFSNGVSLTVRQPNFTGDWFSCDFAAPDGQLLSVGRYEAAMRYPFQSAGRPGLDVSGNGRGNNMLTGSFTVHEIEFVGGSGVVRFAASFELYGDGSTAPLRGVIRYNAAAPLLQGVTGNDVDPEADDLRAQLLTGPAHGTLAFNPSGAFEYTPHAGFHGTDAFTYRASDGALTSDPVTVTITVRSVNDVPVAPVVNVATKVPDPVDGRVVGTDADGDPLTYSLRRQAFYGTAVVRPDGSFTYTPDKGAAGTDSFTVLVSDGKGGATAATVIVAVTPNAAPVTARDAARVREDGVVTIDVLANDSDPEGGPLRIVAPAGPPFGVWFTLDSGARLMRTQDGTFTYDPNGAFDHLLPGDTVAEEITYFVSDEAGLWEMGFLTITVYGRGGADLVGYSGGEWWVTYTEGRNTGRWAAWKDAAWDALRQGDVDGDGYADVAGFIDGAWYIGWRVAAGFKTSDGPVWKDAVWRDVAIRDVNGDGRDDLIGRTAGEWWVSLSTSSVATGPSFAKATRWAAWADAGWDAVFFDDLNADGRADLLGLLDGQWWVALSTGSGFADAKKWADWADAAWDALGTFDPDGDGRADLYGMIGGEWWVGRSTGTGFQTSLRDRWAAVAWEDVRAGDFDGDGREDLAGRFAGEWYVGFSDRFGAGPRETALFGLWVDSDWEDVRAGDFDGDGRTDLIGRLDGAWWLAASTGLSSTNRLWATWADADWKAVGAAEVDGFVGAPASAGSLTAGSAPSALRAAPESAAKEEDLGGFWSRVDEDDEFLAGLLVGR